MREKVERAIAGALRMGVVAIAVILQLALLVGLTIILKNNTVYVYALIEIVALIVIFRLVGSNKITSYTIPWIMVIMLLPVYGQFLYLLWGHSDTGGRRNRKLKEAHIETLQFINKDPAVYENFKKQYPHRKRLAGYLGRKDFPLYENTKCTYFPLGERQFEAMLKDIDQAEHFIFLQYFIIGSGKLWDQFREAFLKKADEGVEIRIMYDDLGSIMRIPKDDLLLLESKGVKIIRFNPVHHYISRLSINYRNHQKIVVIDGNIGYTGGINLGDEYANYYPKHGHFKDTAIRLEGEGVWSLSLFFLEMWLAEGGEKTDYNQYRVKESVTANGFFQPFTDGPANNPDNPAEIMYRQIINNAREYVYITTPYLVIDNQMMDTLCTAAQGGTDVRIITPKVWDHWYVHMVTQSNYGELLKAGVRIYEYTPGFIHAKSIISDDDHGIIGSINMDYRSFYLHFENGVWICGAPVLSDIKNDIVETFEKCEEVFYDDWHKRPWYVKVIQSILRPLAIMF